MRVIDPGHEYLLDSLDGEAQESRLVFVKREGDRHPGTTTQEVLRACIDRLRHVNGQTPCAETAIVAGMLEHAVFVLEQGAARLHGRDALPVSVEAVELCVSGAGKCRECGYVGCTGGCRQP